MATEQYTPQEKEAIDRQISVPRFVDARWSEERSSDAAKQEQQLNPRHFVVEAKAGDLHYETFDNLKDAAKTYACLPGEHVYLKDADNRILAHSTFGRAGSGNHDFYATPEVRDAINTAEHESRDLGDDYEL